MSARGVSVSGVDKARERLESALVAVGLDGCRAELIRERADDLAAERVCEVTIAAIAALKQSSEACA